MKGIIVSELTEVIKGIINTDRDCVIGLSGKTGEGKSTLSSWIAKDIDSKFSFERNMTFSRKETIEKINHLPRKSCVVVDEAINILFRRDFMKGEQKELLKLLDMCRDKNHVLIFNIPNFWSLDSHVQHRVRLWIHIEKRGMGMLFQPTKNPFSRDLWNRRNNEKLSNKNRLLKSKNFIGFVSFQKLSGSEMRTYLRVKREKKKLLVEQEKPETYDYNTLKRCVEVALIHQAYQLKEKGYLACKIKDIAKMRGLSPQAFRQQHTRTLTINKLIEPVLYNK